MIGAVKQTIRLKWCRENADWDEDRKYVFWADEARFPTVPFGWQSVDMARDGLLVPYRSHYSNPQVWWWFSDGLVKENMEQFCGKLDKFTSNNDRCHKVKAAMKYKTLSLLGLRRVQTSIPSNDYGMNCTAVFAPAIHYQQICLLEVH